MKVDDFVDEYKHQSISIPGEVEAYSHEKQPSHNSFTPVDAFDASRLTVRVEVNRVRVRVRARIGESERPNKRGPGFKIN